VQLYCSLEKLAKIALFIDINISLLPFFNEKCIIFFYSLRELRIETRIINTTVNQYNPSASSKIRISIIPIKASFCYPSALTPSSN